MTIQELIDALSALPDDVKSNQQARVWDSLSGLWAEVASVSPYDEDEPPSLSNPVDVNINMEDLDTLDYR